MILLVIPDFVKPLVFGYTAVIKCAKLPFRDSSFHQFVCHEFAYAVQIIFICCCIGYERSTDVLSKSLELDFVLETVTHLLENHSISLDADVLIHSDQGFHYTSKKFRQLLKDCDLRQSMSRRGNCWDNAPQESFFGHMKDEIDVSNCTTFEQVKLIIDDWIDYYNNDRYQWQLAKLSPNEFYAYLTTGIYPLKGVPTIQNIGT